MQQANTASQLTWCDGVDESTDGRSVVPVRGEVVDRFVRYAALDPMQQALLRRLIGRLAAQIIAVPHRHRDGVVQDQRPHESEYELHLAVDDVRAVCKFRHIYRNATDIGKIRRNES